MYCLPQGYRAGTLGLTRFTAVPTAHSLPSVRNDPSLSVDSAVQYFRSRASQSVSRNVLVAAGRSSNREAVTSHFPFPRTLFASPNWAAGSTSCQWSCAVFAFWCQAYFMYCFQIPYLASVC